MVEFQPWTLTTPDLGSVAYCYSLVYPFRPTFLFSCFMDLSFLPLFYLLPVCSLSTLNPSQFLTPTHLLPWCRAPPSWTSPASTACTCAPLRVSAYAVVPIPVCSPIFRPRPALMSLSAPGGFARCGSLCFIHSFV